MKNFQTKPIEEWIAQGKKNSKQYVFYDGFCLDLSSFKNLHPGGSQVLRNYIFKDVTNTLFTVFPHNKLTAPKILQKYKIGVLNYLPAQRTRKQGTILKQRRQEKQNSMMKKSVQFPSDIRILASQKERMQQMKPKKSKNSKNRLKKSIAMNGSKNQEQKSKRTKNIDQNYLQVLKGSKTVTKPTKSQNEIPIQYDRIKQSLNFTKFDSGQLPIIKENTVNVSIKKHLVQSQSSFQDFVEQSTPLIKVPVFTVRLDRIW